MIGAYAMVSSPDGVYYPYAGARPPQTSFAEMTTRLNLAGSTSLQGSTEATVTSSPTQRSTLETLGGIGVDILNSVLRRTGSGSQVGVVVGQGAPGGGVSPTGSRTFEAGTVRDQQPILFYGALVLGAVGLFALIRNK